jgi:hypothetical protein
MFSKNAALWWIVGITLLFLTLVISIPVLMGIFSFATPGPFILAVSVAAAVISTMWFELFKVIRNRRRMRNKNAGIAN